MCAVLNKGKPKYVLDITLSTRIEKLISYQRYTATQYLHRVYFLNFDVLMLYNQLKVNKINIKINFALFSEFPIKYKK